MHAKQSLYQLTASSDPFLLFLVSSPMRFKDYAYVFMSVHEKAGAGGGQKRELNSLEPGCRQL